MTEWLFLTDEQRRQTLTQAATNSGIATKALEKDWWVTLTLKALFQSAQAPWMVFKGGTSLSKGFKLIQRFSEDIDIALDPAAFNRPHQPDPSNTFVHSLKKDGCVYTSTTLREELVAQLTALGVPAGMVTIEAKEVPAKNPDTDPQTLYVYYPPLYDPNPYIADEVRVEVSVRSLQMPVTQRPILSLLSEFFPGEAYPEQPFMVTIMEPRKTFLEKLFLLHEEFAKPDRTKIRHKRMSRHPFDLVKLMNSPVAAEALADHGLYNNLISHRQRYSKISWVDYQAMGHDTISFLPPPEVLNRYEEDYVDMQEYFIHEENPPSFSELHRQLKLLQGMVRMKKTGRTLDEIIRLALNEAKKIPEEKVRVSVTIAADSAGGQSEQYHVEFILEGEILVFESVTVLQ